MADPHPHDAPAAAGLVEAVREFLEGDVMAATQGRVQFHTRVAVNTLRIVERELALGAEQAQRHAAGLARLGLKSERELAALIRAGGPPLEDKLVQVATFVRSTVADKLAVANPSYRDA